jgi:signal peptidase I
MSELTVATKTKKEETFLETLKSLVWVVLVVLLIRTFLFEPFNIPSGSLIPTILVGDYVFVWKAGYGYSKYSFPFWNPPFSGRVFGRMPNRGDIAVFRLPRDPSIVYVKRVIGLPGDRIQVTRGQLYLNGEAVPRQQIEDLVDEEAGFPRPLRQFVETLPNGVVHNIIQEGDDGLLDTTQEYLVPPDHLFMMGDNRSNSEDSRALSAVGYVPFENLIGPAEFRFFSIRQVGQSSSSTAPTMFFDAWFHKHAWWEFWWWPFEIRYFRFFTPVR